MAHQKREVSFADDDCASKRPKCADSATEERSGEAAASRETNGEMGSTSQKENGKLADKCGVEEKALTNSKVSGEQEKVLTGVEVDAAEDKGCRHTMEDTWVVLPDADTDSPGTLRCAHFAIYDGHGGRLAAEYAQKHLHQNVIAAGLPLMDVKTAKKAIIEGFRRTDESLLQESTKAVVVANAGDAKAVLARSTLTGDEGVFDGTKSQLKAIVLTREHKAIFPQERSRIQKAGGSVGPNGRLQGRIEVSRAFGDRQFKKVPHKINCSFSQKVGLIATPDVHSFELTKKDHFIVLGCDGLWGVFGPSDAVEFVQKQLKGDLFSLTGSAPPREGSCS
ncbi:hypothetical protein ACP4OV_023824 [Aristida adscensionis]